MQEVPSPFLVSLFLILHQLVRSSLMISLCVWCQNMKSLDPASREQRLPHWNSIREKLQKTFTQKCLRNYTESSEVQREDNIRGD